MTHHCRSFLTLLLCLAYLEPALPAQKKKRNPDEDGMVLEVSTKPEKRNKKDEMTQTLPLPKEAPSAVVADTDKLFFQVSPLSNKGLLSAQTREAMRALLRSTRGTNVIKLRAFVAGSGDMRRIQEIAGEVFAEKKQPLPALSVVQVGALAMEGAQVVIESIGMDRKPVNPNGIAFLAGQAADSLPQSLDKLKTALKAAALDSSDVLKLSCFVSSLEENKAALATLPAQFPTAAVNMVQMQRLPTTPGAECEAIARLRASAEGQQYLNPAGLDQSPAYSQIVLVHASKLVFTGTQMGFGAQEDDVKLAFDRLQKGLGANNARLDNLAMSHFYVPSMKIADKIRSVRKNYYGASNPPASTFLPFEALPSLDASFGVDVVAVQNP